MPRRRSGDDESAFDAWQNAEVAAGAERYYRIMVRGDRESWNIRDRHMADTIDRLAHHLGPASKGLVWEHNTHVGDARATDMAGRGMVNVGQLLRERHGVDGVALVGFAGHRGTVVAGAAWGAPEPVLRRARWPGPAATRTCCTGPSASRPSSTSATTGPARGSTHGSDTGPSASCTSPVTSRATTCPPGWATGTTRCCGSRRPGALRPLHHEGRPTEPELETEPSGF